MDEDLDKISKIGDYLEGNLNPEQLTDFETRLIVDSELREEVELMKTVINALPGCALKNMLSEIHEELYGRNSEQ